MRRILVATLIIALGAASQARAQLVEHGYLQANGAGTANDPSVSAEAGVRLTRGLALFVGAGQIGSFDTPTLFESDAFTDAVIGQLGPSVVTTVEAFGSYVDGGFRYEVGTGRWHLQPYVLSSVGVAELHQRVRFRLWQGRDVTEPVVRFDLLGHDPSAIVLAPMATAGAGVTIPVKRLRVDVGYRLSQFITGGAPVRTGHLMVGAGIRF
jgi:hypothetical protein